jgi:hypothetical protein
VHADQWSDVDLIRASYSGHLSLAALWAQHNENRMLFPDLLAVAMSRLDAFNVSGEEYLSALLLIAAVALIIARSARWLEQRSDAWLSLLRSSGSSTGFGGPEQLIRSISLLPPSLPTSPTSLSLSSRNGLRPQNRRASWKQMQECWSPMA